MRTLTTAGSIVESKVDRVGRTLLSVAFDWFLRPGSQPKAKGPSARYPQYIGVKGRDLAYV
jgi:hypothetical protein